MTQAFWEKAKEFLFRRRTAYLRVFDNPHGEEVLADLAKFCRAHETTFRPESERESALLEGRREVWLRIERHLRLPPERLWKLYAGVE